MHRHATTGFAVALSVLVLSHAHAESVMTPSSLRTHQISASIVNATLSDFVSETFANASAHHESIGAHIGGFSESAELSVETSGSRSEDIDDITFNFSNNLGPSTTAWGEVMFATTRNATISLGGLVPGGTGFEGEFSAEIWTMKQGLRIAEIVETNQSIELRAHAQYRIHFQLDGNTQMGDHTGTWTFHVDYAQAHAVPGLGGLVALFGLGLARRRHR